MNVRIMTRPLAVFAAAAILVAACGGGSSSAGPDASAAQATQASATGPVETELEPSFDTSSFHADTQLEDVFPDSISGEPMTVLSVSGEQFMALGAASELDAMLTAVDRSASDMSVAYGGAGNVAIIGFKLRGVPGDTIFTALFTAYGQTDEATITDVKIAGKMVKKVVPVDGLDTTYIYAAQDVVFSVGGDGITDAQLNEAFSKLP